MGSVGVLFFRLCRRSCPVFLCKYFDRVDFSAERRALICLQELNDELSMHTSAIKVNCTVVSHIAQAEAVSVSSPTDNLLVATNVVRLYPGGLRRSGHVCWIWERSCLFEQYKPLQR